MPSPQSFEEALALVDETLRALELNQIALVSVAMRCARIAALLDEPDFQRLFSYEIGGYPSSPDGFPPDIWRLAGLANRHYRERDSKTNEIRAFAYHDSIEAIEVALQASRERAAIPDDSPFARLTLNAVIGTSAHRLAARRALLFDYLSSRYHQLRYSGIAADAFDRLRTVVDSRIAQHVPAAVERFDSVYSNLQSENPEDWANAVHSCRRMLEHLADSLFPPTAVDRVTNGKTIKLGVKHYKNRILCYVEDKSSSETFSAVVGSTFTFLEDRLEALFRAANKATHASISKPEADRYVVYTYLIIGDILSL